MTLRTPNRERLLIVGASVRSAAQSAVRAGFEPICADLFADADLGEIARVDVVKDYPDEFVNWAERVNRQNGRLPLIYTGGLENYPATVDALARLHDLMGNTGNCLTNVRDPRVFSDCLMAAGIRCPTVQADVPEKWIFNHNFNHDQSENWLKKPIQGSAGFGIGKWRGELLQSNEFLQQYVRGPSVSILYVGGGPENDTRNHDHIIHNKAQLIGATLQLVGLKSLAGGQFGWCGSLGPLRLKSDLISQASRIGNTLAARFGLVGIFGVDCVLSRGSLYPIEVNPRYTGSVEVLEKSIGWQAMQQHIAACNGADPGFGAAPGSSINENKCVGKAILFASRSISVQNLANFGQIVADRPTEGAEIQQSNPVCTIMGEGVDMEDCIDTWSNNVQQVHRHLFGDGVGFGQEIRRLWQQFCDEGVID